jgi:hypothetical protein
MICPQCASVSNCEFLSAVPSAGKSEGLRLHLVSHLTRFNPATCYFVCSAHLASLKWLRSSYFGRLHNPLESLISTLHISRAADCFYLSFNVFDELDQQSRRLWALLAPVTLGPANAANLECSVAVDRSIQRQRPRDCLSPVQVT